MKIPITMCHGIRPDGERPLTVERLEGWLAIARELDFQSIDYDDLAAWRDGNGTLPERPIMFDFDHPVRSMRYEVHDALGRFGYKGNLFIYTGPYEREYGRSLPWDVKYDHMSWDELG